MRANSAWTNLAVCLAVLVGGCGGDARVDLAAADALQSIAASMETAIGEYHTDTVRGDDDRESALVAALLDRVKHDATSDELLDQHGAAFTAALRKVRADRDVEWQRYHAALDNASLMREVAADLRRLAVASMSLEDEMQRYLFALIESRTTSSINVATGQ